MALYCSKKLSALLKRVSSKHDSAFSCLNCLHSFRAKSKLESHEKVCESKDFCDVVINSEEIKILEFNQYRSRMQILNL